MERNQQMEIKKIEYDLTVCKVADCTEIDLSKKFYFIGKTDEEISIVCPTSIKRIRTGRI